MSATKDQGSGRSELPLQDLNSIKWVDAEGIDFSFEGPDTTKRVLSVDDAIEEVGWTQRRWLVLFMSAWINLATGSISTCLSAIGHRTDNLWGYNQVGSLYLTPTLFLGFVISSFFTGPIIDRFGRLPPLFGMLGFLITGFILMITSTNVYLLFSGAFIAGLGYPTLEIAMLMMIEFATGKWRDLHSALWNISWTPGVMISTAWSVYVFPEDSQWRQYAACILSLQLISLILAFFLAPESPRFLLGKKRREDAIDFFRWHRDKGFPVPCKKPKAELNFTLRPPDKLQRTSFLNVINRKYLMISISLWLCTFVGNGLYYSSVLDYPTNHAQLFYLAAAEIPSQPFWFILGRLIGRRLTIAFLFGAEAIMFIIILTSGMKLWILYISRFLMAAAYNYVWLMAPDMYVLPLRGSAMQINGFVSHTAGIIIPVTKAYISERTYAIILTMLAGLAATLGGIFIVDMTGKNMVDIMSEDVSDPTNLNSEMDQNEYIEY